MIAVRFHRLAAKELRAARNWYAGHNAKVAERFLSAADAAILRIREDPTSHPIEIQQIRWVRVARFPYRLIFECLEEDRILIIAVAHTSRRPRYWRRRSGG